jgi:hypothetical protein
MSRSALVTFNLILAVLLALSAGTATAAPAPGGDALVRIWLAGPEADLPLLADGPLVPVAYELLPSPYVLARADRAGLDWLAASGFDVQVLDAAADSAFYCLIDGPVPAEGKLAAGRVLLADQQLSLVRLPAEEARTGCGGMAWPLPQRIRLLPRPAPETPTTVTPLPQVQDIIDQVDVSHMLAYVNDLSGETQAVVNGTPVWINSRYLYSTQQLQLAVDYMSERLERLGLAVTTQQWQVGLPPNVIAEKPGLRPGQAGIYIICAHLDSITYADPMNEAPGADDNASGSVAVLEAAELLAPYNFDATLRFVLFTGEEQGLLGSRAYAPTVANQDIRGVLNMDMIAWDSAGGPDMDLHAKSTVPGSVALAGLFEDVVDAYGLDLLPVTYSNGTGASDHQAFWEQSIAAFLVIENYYSDPPTGSDFNAYYHSINDRTIYFNQPYFGEMSKASLATFAHMASIRTDCYWADLDCNGFVTALDLATAASHWGTVRGDWNYGLVYDANRDDAINVLDVQQFAAQWGWTDPGL